MKVKRVLSICFCTLAISCWVFFSCSTPSSNQSNSLGVDIRCLTSLPINEVDAAFAWHEIAKKQIAACKGKQDFDEKDADSLFMVINEILGRVSCFFTVYSNKRNSQ